MAQTAFGALFRSTGSPTLNRIFGESVEVTPAGSASLTLTARVVRMESVEPLGDESGRKIVRMATMQCDVTSYPDPLEGDDVELETYPGSGVTECWKVSGRPKLIGDTEHMIELRRIEDVEFSTRAYRRP